MAAGINTRLSLEEGNTEDYEEVNTYYYHSDHLGSGIVVTDFEGEVYERYEYTPYGEIWIEKGNDISNKIPYRFNAKELDSETGLYYYGARYLNPKTSRWISSDPAGFDLINPNRRGFNIIEGNNWYSYAGNNPVVYRDPTGNEIVKTLGLDLMTNYADSVKLGNSTTEQVNQEGCYVAGLGNTSGTRSARNYRGSSFNAPNFKATEKLNNNSKLFNRNSGDMAGREKTMNQIFGKGKWDYWTKKVQGVKGLLAKLKGYADSDKKYMVVGIFDLSGATDGVDNHMVGINGMPDENGGFAPENITPTSAGDQYRLKKEDKMKEYNINNLKEFRIIEVDQ